MTRKYKTWSKYSNKNENIFHPEYTVQENPFRDISEQEKEQIFNEINRKIAEELPKLIQALRDQLIEFMPLHPLCLLSYYFLTRPVGTNRKTLIKIEQFQVELLQAFFLKIPLDEYKDLKPLTPDKVEPLIELMDKITSYKGFLRITSIDRTLPNDILKKQFILDSIRNSTEIVRNWAYPEATYRMLKDIYSLVNNNLLQRTKIDVLLLIDFFQELTEIIEERINEHWKKLKEIMKLNDKKEIISKYIEMFPVKNTSEEFFEFSRRFKSRKDFKYWLLGHSDILLNDLFKIDISISKNNYEGRLTENISELLNNLSHEIGDLKEDNEEFFYLDNPIWKKPFIKINNSEYYYPIPSMFQHSNFSIIENLLYPKDKELKDIIGKKKSEYLEKSIEKLFKESFPYATIYKNLYWYSVADSKEYENDVLVIIDNVFIIIEAKSGKFSKSSKRGSLKRIESEFNDLILEPAIQSKRFENFLYSQIGKVKLKDKNGIEIEIDCSSIRNIIRLSITLEFIPVLSSSKRELFESGFIDDLDTITTTMSLNDLEIVLELLPKQSEKIHYFLRRYDFEKNALFDGDELDILVFYLETGFNKGESEYGQETLILQGNSEKLDNYYLFRYYDNSIVKPIPRRTKFWNDILDRFEEKHKPGWTELAYYLLNVSYEDQIKIQEAVEKQSRVVIRDWGNPKLKNAVVLTYGPPQKKEIFVWFLYLDMLKEERNKQVQNIVGQEMERLNVSRALVLGSNLSKNYYPYSFIALLKSNNNNLSEPI
ncbi:MAG: hypothetical protein M1495_00485 [Bacteroidetes bacterium]|nr:hypothetical protein [Bacteroidota bacterium]